jgi:hypothetical protein
MCKQPISHERFSLPLFSPVSQSGGRPTEGFLIANFGKQLVDGTIERLSQYGQTLRSGSVGTALPHGNSRLTNPDYFCKLALGHILLTSKHLNH